MNNGCTNVNKCTRTEREREREEMMKKPMLELLHQGVYAFLARCYFPGELHSSEFMVCKTAFGNVPRVIVVHV